MFRKHRRIHDQLPLLLLLLGAFTASSALADRLEQISDRNRRDHQGDDVAMGGWGPHVRSILSSPSGDLWFVHDAGEDVLRNAGLRYWRRLDGRWIQSASLDFKTPGGLIQQNLAHVLVGTVIHSFGVDTQRQRLVECTLNTLSVESPRCTDVLVNGRPLELEPNSNYIGAALSPGGYPIVWWSSSGKSGATAGRFFHLWRFSEAWNGPVETPIQISERSYANLAYARPVFSGRHRLELLGELEEGPLHQAVHVTIEIDSHYPHAQLWLLGLPAQTEAAEDLWADAQGGLHAITGTTKGANSGFYFYRPPGQAWRFVQALPGLTVARFQEEKFTGTLHLLADRGAELVLRSGAVAGHSGPLRFEEFSTVVIPVPSKPDLSPTNAIYNMSRAYQTRDVHGLHFGLVGDSPEADEFVFYLGDSGNP